MGSSGVKTIKRPVATDWVTVNDIVATGVTPVYSDIIFISISDLPDFINPVVEFLFTHRNKNKLMNLIDIPQMKPLVHVSGMFSVWHDAGSNL